MYLVNSTFVTTVQTLLFPEQFNLLRKHFRTRIYTKLFSFFWTIVLPPPSNFLCYFWDTLYNPNARREIPIAVTQVASGNVECLSLTADTYDVFK
jgi:hypothetical protein